MGLAAYYFWRFVHNSIVHGLLISFIGERDWVWRLHEWTGNRWGGEHRAAAENRGKQENRG